jgi:serine/threonine protein kinase/Tol biopolymer transport system component
MAVTAGQKIGPYEVAGQIGAGGMGEVYKARDPRLGRDIAIKVLPPSFSSDPDRLQRFSQEARAAAALNHPNILAIFDIGENKGAPYVVSELLEGETLRDRLRSGGLSTRKAVDFALQMANGLAAAHEKGIVHRDLKPENLFITDDNRLKILDFGLAKLTHPEEHSSSGDAPTMQVATDPGVVMGTVGYMSPEQVRGKPADHRSDIFSFGSILYEMLSGKRAFHGDSPADTMSAILKDDPPELSETGRNIPPALQRIVNHCLEKNPSQRFQSAGDVAFNLESLTEISASSKSGVSAVAVRSPSPRRWLLPSLAALLFAASSAGIYFAAKRSGARSEPSFHRLTFRRGTILAARFSPDGQTIVYGAALEGKPVELFTTRFDSTDSRPLGLEKTQLLAISSRGEIAVSTSARATAAFLEIGTLARVPLAGGAPREVLDNVESADWTPDGSDLAVARKASATLNDLEFPGGKVIYQPQGWVSHVRFSRDGKLLAFGDHVPTGDDGRVVVVDREGKPKVASSFYSSVEGVAWSRDGSEVWFSASPGGAARALYAMNMAGRERLVLRVPGTLSVQDITSDGRVLLTEDTPQIMMMALPPGEKTERNLSWFDWSLAADLSADGKTVIFDESGEAVGAKYGSFMRKTDGSPAVRLGDGAFSVMSPDGKWVASLDLGSPSQIELLPIGAGQPRRLTNDALQHIRVAWVPDGSGLVFIAAEPNHPPRSYWMDLTGKTRALTPEGVAGFAVTADCKYLLTVDGQQRRSLYPLDGGEAKPFLTKLEDNDAILRFEPDGKSILVAQRGVPAKVFRVFLDTGRREQVRQITPPDPAGVQTVSGIHFSADGKSYAYSYFRILSDLWVVDGLK